MRPATAATELRSLVDESSVPAVRTPGPAHVRWKAKAEAVMIAALGADSATLAKFRAMRYHIGVWSGAPGERERDQRYFAKAVDQASALLDAAVYEVELLGPSLGSGA